MVGIEWYLVRVTDLSRGKSVTAVVIAMDFTHSAALRRNRVSNASAVVQSGIWLYRILKRCHRNRSDSNHQCNEVDG